MLRNVLESTEGLVYLILLLVQHVNAIAVYRFCLMVFLRRGQLLDHIVDVHLEQPGYSTS